jgi:hypothetical protein
MKCSCIYPLESDETVFLNHQFVCNYDCSVSEYCGNTIQEANLCTEDYLNIVAVQESTCFNLDTEGGGDVDACSDFCHNQYDYITNVHTLFLQVTVCDYNYNQGYEEGRRDCMQMMYPEL